MTRENKSITKTDPLFDGHLEKDVTKMAPKEKLLYLSMQIQLRHFIEARVKKVPPKGAQRSPVIQVK